ncbi:mycofactocin-associated electron transfer flavoprotein alpha subunit [Thermopolyspora sp. NPDC052614]|uniref:mycofactocin-associated electron transfer flavoprotein alpha subunit n=1 Tax=Thermopolyspora sp. NPDC052614 TaxID=3155682 RepID=UPI003449C96A
MTGQEATAAALPGREAGQAVAVVVARDGRPPAGADEAVAEAGGAVLVVGSGSERAAKALVAAERAWWCDTGTAPRFGALAEVLAPVLAGVPLVVLPASPDGRDLAPRLAAELGCPLLAQAVAAEWVDGGVRAELSRLDDRLLVPVTVGGPAVVTLAPGTRTVAPAVGGQVSGIELGPLPERADVELLDVVEPDPETMDLAEARRVLGAGAGLVPPAADETTARATLDLLTRVGARLGASTGATRVVTDAGWIGHDRQIGTTGVAIDPDLYIAFGVSGAGQHTGGLGSPRHIVSVNTDPHCPMTAMADLGLVTDARELLAELARRLGVAVPGEIAEPARGPGGASGEEAADG